MQEWTRGQILRHGNYVLHRKSKYEGAVGGLGAWMTATLHNVPEDLELIGAPPLKVMYPPRIDILGVSNRPNSVTALQYRL